jgi:hypothetical protein
VTLIASALVGNWPFLFGDLLISVKANPVGDQIHLPVQEVQFVSDIGHSINSLAQKLCIITPNLAVGWSGSKIVAQTVIKEMMEHFTNGGCVTFDEVGKFLFALDFPEARDVQLVGLVHEGNNFVRDFRWNAKTHKSVHFGEMQLAGSGSDHLIELLQGFDDELLIKLGNPPDFATAVSKFLMLAGYILGEERNSRQNLASFYGGGFEIVYFNQGKFDKLGNLTYLFWAVNVISSDKLQIAPQVAIKLSYRKDVLLIHSIDLGISNGQSGSSNAAIFAVEPIHRRLDNVEMEEIKATSIPFPDLNSHIVCHYVSINRPDTKREALVIVDIGQPDMIKFTDDGKSVSFTVYNNWAQRLLEAIQRRTGTRV